MSLRAAAVLLAVAVLPACGPSAATVQVTQLPADPGRSPVAFAVETREGRVFASLLDGSWVTLDAAGQAWVEGPGSAVQQRLVDHQEGLTLGLGPGPTALRATASGFVALERALPGLDPSTFTGQRALLGRDAQGVFWATATATSGASDRTLVVYRVEPASPGSWQLESFPLLDVRHVIPAASQGALTGEGRLFYRPLEAGVWEVDRATHALVERVPCTHPLFRPSHPDYRACQEDAAVFPGRAGALYVLTPTHELWRVPPGSSTPVLVVKGTLPELEVQDEAGFNRYAPGGYQAYVDRQERIWLLFRWGNNDATDVTYLYVADPARGDGWTFLRKDLPLNLALFGDGAAGPLLASQRSGAGLLVFRVAP